MKKLAYSTYALSAYAIGMASIVYLIGFVLDIYLPKTINSGSVAPWSASVWANVLILFVYLTVHSVMARPWFKRRWTKVVPATLERATYVLVSGITTFALIWAWQPLPETIWSVESEMLKLILYGVYALGWALIVLATFNIDHFSFFGLKQVWSFVLNRSARATPFTARFLYGVVRHPISLGWIILFWSTPHMTLGHLLFAICVTVYIAIVTPIEEADLVDALGEDYIQYKERVYGFVPWAKKAAQKRALDLDTVRGRETG